MGGEATEKALRELAEHDQLARYRFIHLATHGKPNPERPFDSELLLARDRPPDRPTADDGRLTAAEVLRTWSLDADLVTLSACQSALGRHAGGEGYLGFTQALLLAGARSVVLSLWKVDDRATALLMGRFYANLLGEREGLPGPMARDSALSEAQGWLRGLRESEAALLLAALPGSERGTKQKDPRTPRRAAAPPAPDAAPSRPYEHPYYWAAFILVGDPD